MPKFLDAPSWYDDDGNLKTIQGDLTIYVGSGYNITFDVPHVGGTNIDRFGGLGTVSSEYYLLPAAKRPGQIPYYTNASGGYQTLPSGTSGQVLTSNGSSAGPGWKTLPLYLHRIYIDGMPGHYTINVYSMSSATLSNNSVSGLVNFLRGLGCTSMDTFFVASGVANDLTTPRTAVGIYASSSSDVFYPVMIKSGSTYGNGLQSGSMVSSSSGVTITEYIIEI